MHRTDTQATPLQTLQEQPEVVDLHNAVVLPGMTDGHTHLLMFGTALNRFDCTGRSLKDIQKLLAEKAKNEPDAPMLLGKGFTCGAVGAPIDKKYLDEVISDRPVMIDSADLHSVWVNSAGAKALGITKDTKNPQGGEYVRDKDGEFTGYIKETAVFQHVWPFMSESASADDRKKFLNDGFQKYLETGVVAASEMSLEAPVLETLETIYKENGNKLPIRINAYWILSPLSSKEELEQTIQDILKHQKRLASHAPWIRLSGIKIISDGVVDSCTAYCSKAYRDGTTAQPIWPQEQMNTAVLLADKHDLQVALHAIGDAAVESALDAFELAIKTNGEKPAGVRRHRVEHLEVVQTEQIQRLAKLGLVASLQPAHADPVRMVDFRESLGHDERCDRVFPWSEYVDANAFMAFGSDAPTAPHDTLPIMHIATTRQSIVDVNFRPEEPRYQKLNKWCVKLPKAIQNYTQGSAFAAKTEDLWGTLEPGKSADFCVLEIDPFKDGLETLREAQEAVVETYVEGKLAFKKQK